MQKSIFGKKTPYMLRSARLKRL